MPGRAVDLAHGVLPNSEGELKLAGEISAALDILTGKAVGELEAYNTALKSGTAGFVHLENAKGVLEGINQVEPFFAPAKKVEAEVARASQAYEGAVRAAQTAGRQSSGIKP